MDAYDKGHGVATENDSAARRSQSAMLSMTALFIAVTALVLAALPIVILERPTPSAAEVEDDIADEPEGRFSLTWKNIKLSFGGRKPAEDEAARGEREAKRLAAEAARAAERQALLRYQTRLRWFSIAAAASAILGLTLGPIAWTRERHPVLAGCAMAISGVALLWQYILVGIVVGIVVVIVLAYFSSLA